MFKKIRDFFKNIFDKLFHRKKNKLTKEQKAELKRRKKRLEARNKNFKGKDGFMAKGGYVEFEGYIHILDKKIPYQEIQRDKEGKYMAIYDVLFQYGTNNPDGIGWLTKVIPSQPLKNGDIFFALRERKMNHDTEEEILSKKLHQRATTTANQQAEDKDQDVRSQSKRHLQLQDMQLAVDLAGAEEEIIDSDFSLVIKSSTVKKLGKTIEELKQFYSDDGISGIILVRRTNEQLDTMRYMFSSVSSDAWHNSDMETVAAGRLFMPSSGFSDETGVYVGEDASSFLVNNPSIIDFSNVRHAVISTGHVPGLVSVGGLEAPQLLPNYGSFWAHVIAEDNYLIHGTRTHHITLVPFDFYEPNSKVFDMNKYSINALETYGTRETVVEDANNNFSKVAEIIMMLLSEEDPDPSIKAMLRERLVSWVTYRANKSGMYTTDPVNEPTRAYQILATTNHKAYPTLQDFITELQSLTQEAERQSPDAYNKAKMLLDSVRTASRLHPSVFSKATDIPDHFGNDDRNIYYDLSHISDDPMTKGAIFLNTLAYVVHRANPGDLIVVHGLDSVKIRPQILRRYRDKMDKKNIGLITTFEELDNEEVNVDSMKDFCGSLSNQDLIVLGGITNESAYRIKKAWGNRELPEIVANTLLDQPDDTFYVYRKSDFQSAVIRAHLIL